MFGFDFRQAQRFGGLLPGEARAASVDGSSLSLLAMTGKPVIELEIIAP
jgi:hypothetical protein